MRQKSCKPSLGVRIVNGWTVAFVGLMAVGCGGQSYSLVDVSGTISMDDKPLANASITFVPVGDGVGPASAGMTDQSGHYVLQTIDLDLPGAVSGTHRVTITTARAEAADERATISKELVPPRYRDGSFRFEVDAEGTPAADIEIQN